MKKVGLLIAWLIVIVAGLSVFGFWVKNVLENPAPKGIHKVLKDVVTYPDQILQAFESKEITRIPPTFEPVHFHDTINHLKQDLYGINSYYKRNPERWEVTLFNFKTDDVLHRWTIKPDSFHFTLRQFSNSEPRNAILLEDGSIVVTQDESHNLYRIDSASNIVWHNTGKEFHHSLNPGLDNTIWTCTSEEVVFTYPNTTKYAYKDNFLTQVDAQTGQIILDKSVSDIFREMGRFNWIYGTSNTVNNPGFTDPIHLNDVEPVLENGLYWKAGDVFLSLRNRSMILQYRPAVDSVIRIIEGPFLHQHDVDVINDSTLVFYNNSGTTLGNIYYRPNEKNPPEVKERLSNSHLMLYHFGSNQFEPHLKSIFDSERFFSRVQGLQHPLSNGNYYVEHYTAGLMYIMSEDSVVYKRHTHNRYKNYAERPHWIRVYEDLPWTKQPK
jgi:hypothetical protein